MQDAWSFDRPVGGGPVDHAAELDRLATRAAAGDRGAFEQIYRSLVDDLYIYVHSLCPNDADAEDIVATVFLNVWRSLHRYRPGSGTFRNWLFAAARNEIHDHLRAVTRTTALDAVADSVVPTDTSSDAADVRSRVLLALSILTAEQREVVVLRYLNEKGTREIAAILGKREGAVRAMLHRALRHMQKVLSDAAS